METKVYSIKSNGKGLSRKKGKNVKLGLIRRAFLINTVKSEKREQPPAGPHKDACHKGQSDQETSQLGLRFLSLNILKGVKRIKRRTQGKTGQ
jgi:hypothetical protein